MTRCEDIRRLRDRRRCETFLPPQRAQPMPLMPAIAPRGAARGTSRGTPNTCSYCCLCDLKNLADCCVTASTARSMIRSMRLDFESVNTTDGLTLKRSCPDTASGSGPVTGRRCTPYLSPLFQRQYSSSIARRRPESFRVDDEAATSWVNVRYIYSLAYSTTVVESWRKKR
jgi:hypothetical protein